MERESLLSMGADMAHLYTVLGCGKGLTFFPSPFLYVISSLPSFMAAYRAATKRKSLSLEAGYTHTQRERERAENLITGRREPFGIG